MGDIIRVQGGQDTLVPKHGVHQTLAIPASQQQDDAGFPAPPNVQIKIGGVRYSTMGGGDGEVSAQSPQRYIAGETDSNDPMDRVRTPEGYPTQRFKATEKDIVKIGGIEANIAGWVRQGVLEPDPRGGFKLAEKALNPPTEQKEQQQQPTPMERISDAAEASMASAAKILGPISMTGALMAGIEGNEANLIPELASRLEVEPHVVQQSIDVYRAEFTEQAKNAVNRAGVEDWDGFTDWANEPANKGRLLEAVKQQVVNGDLTPLRELARVFVVRGQQFSDDEILNADFGDSGVVAYRDGTSGKVALRLPDGRTLSYQQALASRIIKVSKKR